MKRSQADTPISDNVSSSNKEPFLQTFKFFEINHCSYQPLNFLPCNTEVKYCDISKTSQSNYQTNMILKKESKYRKTSSLSYLCLLQHQIQRWLSRAEAARKKWEEGDYGTWK